LIGGKAIKQILAAGRNLFLPLMKRHVLFFLRVQENSLSLHILPLSGFLTAFGTWYENIKNKLQ
jgi:hypothetical protein